MVGFSFNTLCLVMDKNKMNLGEGKKKKILEHLSMLVINPYPLKLVDNSIYNYHYPPYPFIGPHDC